MTNTSRKSSKQGSKMDSYQMPLSSVTYVPSTGNSIEDWLTSLRQDSPVSLTATPGNVPEKTMTETSGLTHSESSEKSNPDMPSLKTSPAYYPRQELARWNQQDQTWEMPQLGLLGTQQQLSGSFPRSGSAANGKLYPPRTLAHRTSDRGGGVSLGWKETHHVPTPTASDHITRKSTSSETLNYETNKSVSLDRWATHWPTPNSRDYKDALTSKPNKQTHLLDMIRKEQQNWPTPNVSDSKGANMKDDHDVKRDYLRGMVQKWPTPSANEDAAGTPEGNMQRMLGNHPDVRSQGDGTLNPSWVGWLMGLPHNWESLDPIAKEDFDAWVEYQRIGTWWDEERGLPRVSTGVRDRVNRLKALGNGIVPACVAHFLLGIEGEK